MTIWTEKHRDFAIAHNLPQSAWSLWEYLVLEGYQGSEIIDLRDFNKWVEKNRGKGYDRRTLKSAAQRLEEAGVISLEKGGNFTAFVKKWIVKPLGALLKPILRQGKRSKLRSPNATNGPSNDISASDGDVTTTADLIQGVPEQLISELEENIAACQEAGISYKPKDAARILACNPEDVKAALNLFHKQGGHATHPSPEGWLRKCLVERWWEEPLKPLTLTSVLTFVYKQIRGFR